MLLLEAISKFKWKETPDDRVQLYFCFCIHNTNTNILCILYYFLLYFAWADQRTLQCYIGHTALLGESSGHTVPA